MRRFFFALLAVMVWMPFGAFAQVAVAVANDAELSLSLAQESEEAIDRAERWLPTHPLPKDAALRTLYDYLQTPQTEVFVLQQCDLTPVEQAMPAKLSVADLEDFLVFLQTHRSEPKLLFALQRDLGALSNPPIGWRDAVAKTLVNTQKVVRGTGHWNDSAEDTLWAVLALKALLHASPAITIEKGGLTQPSTRASAGRLTPSDQADGEADGTRRAGEIPDPRGDGKQTE